MGLGASKAKVVDFEEAERKALEEAERIAQLGYDRQREEEAERARKEAEERRKFSEAPKANSMAAANGYLSKPAPDTLQPLALPRLGFGAVPNAGATVPSTAAPRSKYVFCPSSDSVYQANLSFAARHLSEMMHLL